MEPQAEQPKSDRRRIVSRVIRVGATVILLGVLVATQDLSEAFAQLSTLTPGIAVSAIGLFTLANAVMGFRWWLVLRALDSRLPFLWLMRTVYVGLSASVVLPSSIGGDAIRGMLARSAGLSLKRAATSLIVDRGLGVTALGILVAVLASTIPEGLVPPSVLLVARVLVGVGAVVGLFFAWRRATGEGVRKIRARWLVMALGVALLAHVATLGALISLARSVGIDAPALAIAACATMAWLAALAPITVGGFGVRETVLVTMLGQIGVPSDQALAATMLWTAAILLNALIGTVLMPEGIKKEPPSEIDV